MTPTHGPLRTIRARSGLSVVEVLVALMLVAIGLLGIAGSSALALRTALAAAGEHRAARQATSRLAQLSASGCTLARSGAATDTIRQIREQWIVTSPAGGYAIATDSVDWLDGRGRRSLTLATAIKC